MNDAMPDKVIDDVAYRLVRLDPMVAGRVAARTGQLLAHGLADNGDMVRDLIGTFQKQKAAENAGEDAPKSKLLDMLEDAPMLISALAGGFSKIEVGELYDLATQCVVNRLFAKNTRLNDMSALNRHFSEYPGHLLQILVWGLQVNCKGFFVLGVLASKLVDDARA